MNGDDGKVFFFFIIVIIKGAVETVVGQYVKKDNHLKMKIKMNVEPSWRNQAGNLPHLSLARFTRLRNLWHAKNFHMADRQINSNNN